jgi:anti-sigma factor RsiW
MITNIQALGRDGIEREFLVSEGPIHENGYAGVRYTIRTADMSPFIGFTVDFLFLPNNRILQFMLLSNYIPEVSGKGIVKAMMKAVSQEFQRDIVSSTNIGTKVSESEGRIPDMDIAWKKWFKELPNVGYLPDEDRFIYRYLPKN